MKNYCIWVRFSGLFPLCLLLIALSAVSIPLRGAFQVTDITPISGPIGTTVTLEGEGFDEIAGVGVTVNGTPATGVVAGTSTITFNIANGTTSGEIVVTTDSESFELAFPFEVKRAINGDFNPPTDVTLEGYQIGSGGAFSDPNAESGAFSTTVPLDAAGIVWAFREEGDPLFAAVVDSSQPSVTIDAASTAKALAFLSPLLGTRDDARTQDLLEIMDGSSEALAVAALIESNSADNGDYLDAPGFDGTLQALISKAVNTEVPEEQGAKLQAFESGTPKNTRLKEINPNYSTSIPATNVRLDSKLNDLSPKNPRDYILEIGSVEGKSNPLDWAVQIWELSEHQFPSGFSSVDEVTFNDTFDFFDERPVATGFVGAELDASKLDVVEIIANKVLDLLFAKSDDSFKPNEFLLPKDIDTIYVSQAFSGNLWYGTDFFFTPGPGGKSQTNVLDSDDPNSQWEFALASNIMIAAIDVVSVAVDLKDFVKKETLAGFLQSVFVDVSKSIQIMQNSEGGLNVENTYIIVRKVAEGVLKAAISETLDAGITTSLGRLVTGVGKTLGKVFDITGKISAVEQSLERAAGFALPNALALERSLVVIGDPFEPFIDSLTPNEGQEGDTVTIRGRNFGWPLTEFVEHANEDITVAFCQFTASSTEPDQPSDKRLAVVGDDFLSRTMTQIRVKVPQNFDAVFESNFPIYVCIIKGDKETSSRNLEDAGKFKLFDPPSILSITPNRVLRGGYFNITGERFGKNSIAVIDDFFELKPIRVEDTFMLVQLPSPTSVPTLNDGEHKVKVRRNMRESPEGTFHIGYPPHTVTTEVPATGWSINVTVANWSNVADGEISLLEAMLLANGDLGRPLEVHLACEEIPINEGGCEPQQREVDHIINFYDQDDNPRPGGVGFRDSIHIDFEIMGSTIAVGSEGVPPIGNGDVIDFRGLTLDGTGAPGDAHALFLDNAVSNTSLEDVTIRNFGGDGLRLGNQCQDNTFRDITIEDVGGHGVSLFTSSSGNTFFNISVDGTDTGHGILLVGNSDNNTFTTYEVANTGGSGIRIEDGSIQNTFSNATQTLTTTEDIDNLDAKIWGIGAHGVHLLDGANRNLFTNTYIDTTIGAGIFLETSASENRFRESVIKDPATHGIHLSGSLVAYNGFQSHKGGKLNDLEAAWDLEDIILNAGGYGVLIDSGANNNLVAPRRLFDATLGGICIDGAGTDNNTVGKSYRFKPTVSTILPSLNYDSGGHGVHIRAGASGNNIQMMNVSGHTGNGILIEGTGTRNNRISSVFTGFQYFVKGTGLEPFGKPNTENSLYIKDGATDNVIGGFTFARNNFSNDLKNAILIEDESTTGNVIQDTDIGRTPRLASFPREFAGVGMNGIALMKGTGETFVGSTVTDMRVEIDGIVNGAGILMDNSHDNTVLGCFLGSPFEFADGQEENENKIGIHLRNGSQGNRIGQPGPIQGAFVIEDISFVAADKVDELNSIGAKEVGIWIEDSGGSIDIDGSRIDQNIIQNNVVGSSGVGLKISGNSTVNDIGGFRQGSRGFILFSEFFTQDDNYIQGNEAGLLIENVVIADPAERNLFVNNFFSGKLVDEADDLAIDNSAGPPAGPALLITGASSGHIIGETFRHANQFQSGSVGVFLNEVDNNTIRGNIIGGFTGNQTGLVIRNGEGNLIGGGGFNDRNRFEFNGVVGSEFGFAQLSANPDAGGIFLSGGQANTIQNNEIRDGGLVGIIVNDSSSNLIGGPFRGDGNQIMNTNNFLSLSTETGIILRGSSTTLNVLQNNVIGTNAVGADLGVTQNGIEIKEDAGVNLIGGDNLVSVGRSALRVLAPNIIANSGGHGLFVTGGGSVGNSILNNSIYGNGGLGIENAGGGNNELPPPINITLGGGGVTGEVEDIAVIPEGSIVNVFTDSGDQGEVFLGQTTVKAGGSWALTGMPPPALINITATVTHVNTGSTSEFATGGETRAFTIARSDQSAPQDTAISFVNGRAPVHFLTVEAVNDDVRVDSVTVKAADDGTLIEDAQLTGVDIFHDVDGDSKVTSDDIKISSSATFDTDNGSAVIGLSGAVVEAGVPQSWIVRYSGAESPPEGATFSLSVETAFAVSADFLFPFGSEAVAIGVYPIASDNFTVGAPITDSELAAWKENNFPGVVDPLIIGNDADPDNDGLSNFEEYALGTDPNVPNAMGLTELLIENGVLVFEFQRLAGSDQLFYIVEFSDDMNEWEIINGIIDQTEVIDNGDGTETVRITTTLTEFQITRQFARLQVEL